MSLSDTARPFFSRHLPAVFIPSAMVTLREIPILPGTASFCQRGGVCRVQPAAGRHDADDRFEDQLLPGGDGGLCRGDNNAGSRRANHDCRADGYHRQEREAGQPHDADPTRNHLEMNDPAASCRVSNPKGSPPPSKLRGIIKLIILRRRRSFSCQILARIGRPGEGLFQRVLQGGQGLHDHVSILR